MKLTGNSIVSLNTKFTLFLTELFCIPIKRIKNKIELNEIVKNSFLREKNILKLFLN